MHEIVKNELKNLDINNLTKEDIKRTLLLFLEYFSKIEMLPLRRWNWNHIRLEKI